MWQSIKKSFKKVMKIIKKKANTFSYNDINNNNNKNNNINFI